MSEGGLLEQIPNDNNFSAFEHLLAVMKLTLFVLRCAEWANIKSYDFLSFCAQQQNLSKDFNQRIGKIHEYTGELKTH